jgi:hypothetical protein
LAGSRTLKEAPPVDPFATSIVPPYEPTLLLITCYPFDAVVPGGPLREPRKVW